MEYEIKRTDHLEDALERLSESVIHHPQSGWLDGLEQSQRLPG